MKSIRRIIVERVSEALVAVLGAEGAEADPLVAPSQDSKRGDYQSNCAMGLAKKLGRKPRELAEQIVAGLKIDDLCEPPTIAGPGFINFRLKNEFLAAALGEIPPAQQEEDRLGIPRVSNPQVVVVDMSSPNLAKEMHVGHLRPTIIGDAVARILEFQGHDVHRINHIGDWGTQFGMLIEFLRETEPRVLNDPDNLQLGDLEEFYVKAKARFDSDEAFASQARQAVVDLQSGDQKTRTIWRAFCDESLRHCHAIYDALGIENLEDRGESFYNDMLAGVVQELQGSGVAVESDGAICVFPKGFTRRDDEPLPLIIRKSDGGFGYATTDLAALKYRLQEMGARRIIYVVGNQQKQHFAMLFAALAMTGWADENVETVHLPTGMLLNQAGSPFKTREGGTVKLKTLLDEAVERSRAFLQAGEDDPEKRRGYTAEQIDEMAGVIGIASVKYFELSHNLATDYKFSWDHMLALDGNTAPYMLYAYARIQSIGRKADVQSSESQRAAGFSPRGPSDSANVTPESESAQAEACGSLDGSPVIIEHPSEAGLARQLLKFPEVIEQLGRDLKPNVLTEYLYDLSKSFSTFYDRKAGVRVIDAESEELRRSRLRLCELTGRTLKVGLSLLGIQTLERM
ncbi:MAG: arginine--tRNA ligase [Planctomycetes bacterium]|nr:arginine--tRNA ligase [Planctomycetota bacterium]